MNWVCKVRVWSKQKRRIARVMFAIKFCPAFCTTGLGGNWFIVCLIFYSHINQGNITNWKLWSAVHRGAPSIPRNLWFSVTIHEWSLYKTRGYEQNEDCNKKREGDQLKIFFWKFRFGTDFHKGFVTQTLHCYHYYYCWYYYCIHCLSES